MQGWRHVGMPSAHLQGACAAGLSGAQVRGSGCGLRGASSGSRLEVGSDACLRIACGRLRCCEALRLSCPRNVVPDAIMTERAAAMMPRSCARLLAAAARLRRRAADY